MFFRAPGSKSRIHPCAGCRRRNEAKSRGLADWLKPSQERKERFMFDYKTVAGEQDSQKLDSFHHGGLGSVDSDSSSTSST